MKTTELKRRTKDFALRIIRMTEVLPQKRAADVIDRQLIRSSTSVAANYRAACRAKSRADFIAKMGAVEEEADESAFWLDLIAAGLLPSSRLSALAKEADELTAIAVKSIRTARSRAANPQTSIRIPQ